MTTIPLVNLLANHNWTRGFTTPLLDPAHGNIIRGNMRVPNNFYFAFIEGLEPRLPEQDPTAPWLAPEMVFHSADGLRHEETDTERLPENEVSLFLAPDAPVVYHVFKAWGIQWWRLGVKGNYRAQTYKFRVELFNDVYNVVGNERVPPDDPRAMEWRIRVGTDTDTDPPFTSSVADFRHWNTVERTFIHPGGLLDVSLEVRARWGVDVVGAFLRRPSLVALNSSPTPPPADGGGVPTDKLALLTTLVTALDVRIGLVEAVLNSFTADYTMRRDMILEVLNGLRADRDAILTELLRLRNLPAD